MSGALSELVAIGVGNAALVGLVAYSKGADAGLAAGAVAAVLVGALFGAGFARVAEQRGWTMNDRAQMGPTPLWPLALAIAMIVVAMVVNDLSNGAVLNAALAAEPYLEGVVLVLGSAAFAFWIVLTIRARRWRR